MRKAFEEQRRFGCQPVKDIVLNVNCRDEIIPLLAALKHIYSKADVRDRILTLVAADGRILALHEKGRGRRLEAEQSPADEIVPSWPQIKSDVSAGEDFNDDGDYCVFATRLPLGHGDNYATIVVH